MSEEINLLRPFKIQKCCWSFCKLMDIIVLLSIPDWIHQVEARDAGSRSGRQNRSKKKSRVDNTRRIGEIDRVTRARR